MMKEITMKGKELSHKTTCISKIALASPTGLAQSLLTQSLTSPINSSALITRFDLRDNSFLQLDNQLNNSLKGEN